MCVVVNKFGTGNSLKKHIYMLYIYIYISKVLPNENMAKSAGLVILHAKYYFIQTKSEHVLWP